MNGIIKKAAQKLWEYHHMKDVVDNVDCIFVFGSHDTRVAERGAELFLAGIAPVILFSGGYGRITTHTDGKTEAEKFADIARGLGVKNSAILIENQSTNSGENVDFSMQLVQEKGIPHETILLVQKPYMERRAYASFKKRFPSQRLIVTSQQVGMLEYCGDDFERIVSLMVGDLDRILKYPEKGRQIPQDVPVDVLDAMQVLIENGYTEYLVK